MCAVTILATGQKKKDLRPWPRSFFFLFSEAYPVNLPSGAYLMATYTVGQGNIR